MHHRIIFLLILAFSPFFLDAQIEPPSKEKHGLRMIARATDNAIMLRWAPTSYFTWARCNELGYKLVRHTLKRDGQLLPIRERAIATPLTPEAIFPWQTEAEWRPLMERDEYAAIGAQAIFGDSFTVETGTEDSEVSLTNRAAEQMNRFGFGLFAADHSFEAASAMGLAFVDETAKPNEEYLYMVYPDQQPVIPMDTLDNGTERVPLDFITRIDTGHYSISLADRYLLPKILEVKATFDNKTAMISWDKKMFNQFYVSYIVEKSEDGVNWKPVRDKPFISTDRDADNRRAFLPDTLAQNNKPYFYRVKGRTPFGEYGPPSDPVQGMGKDPMPNFYPTITSVTANDQGGFNLGWEFNESDNAKIRGFKVLRGRKDSGPFETLTLDQLLLPTQRFFIDDNPMPSNYYLVVAIDQYNREMTSFAALAQLDDITPPAVPTNLRGTILKNGIMVATWAENSEPDFLGYRVYVSNHPKAEFTQVTSKPIKENHFIDTISLETLTENIFVKVFAVDYRQNASEFSEALMLTRPDTIPPTAPVFKEVKSSEEAVYLEWANSSSADVVRHELYRKEKGKEQWELLHTIELTEFTAITSFQDSTAEAGTDMEYQVIAVDNGEMKTGSKIVQSRVIDNFIREPIKDLKAMVDRRAKNVTLNWEYKKEDKVRSFIIYRSRGEGKMASYQGLSPEESGYDQGRGKRKKRRFSFVDNGVRMNQQYQYSVKVIYHDGGQSKLSEPVTVDY